MQVLLTHELGTSVPQVQHPGFEPRTSTCAFVKILRFCHCRYLEALRCLQRQKHSIFTTFHLSCQITKMPIHLAGTLFVDDTNLEHLDMTKVETIMETHKAMQCSIHNWGRILIATGGALKPVKCFYHLILFSWNLYGTWRYDANNRHPDLSIMVPLEDGSFAAIEHLPVTTPTKTLGQMTCPMVSSHGAIAQMQEKAKRWIAKAKENKLHKGNLNFLLDKQFWPRVFFGISSMCAMFEELEECLMRIYYDMLPLCGILRQMDRGFYGIGLPHPGVKCFVAQINKVLIHYGCSSGLGIHMQASMEMLIIECGISTQILAEPFSQYRKWVTHCWLSSVWE
jgi:hypothetical protein